MNINSYRLKIEVKLLFSFLKKRDQTLVLPSKATDSREKMIDQEKISEEKLSQKSKKIVKKCNQVDKFEG